MFPLKPLCLAVAAASALLTSASAATIHTYLIGGQSNADGRALAADLPPALQAPQTDVDFYYAANPGLTALAPVTAGSVTRFGPEITFGRSMADYYAPSGDSVAILKYARGATDLVSDWAAGGDATPGGDGAQYTSFQNTIASGLAALQAANPGDTIVIHGMLWVQGEQDITDSAPGGAFPTATADYAANLTQFIGDIRATFGEDITFYFTQISDNQTVFSNPADPDYPYYLQLRAAQASVASNVPDTVMINIDGPQYSMREDHLHFDAAGQQAIGQAFASAAQAVPEPSSAMLLAAAGLALAGTRRRGR